MTSASIEHTVQSSELSRNSAAVFAAAESGPVAITRRDGEGFVLLRARDVAEEQKALRVAFDVLLATLPQDASPIEQQMLRQFPWLQFLTPERREEFADEMVATARACASVGRFSRLLTVYASWYSTAEALAAGITPDDDLDWLDEPEPVGDPRAGG